LNLLLLLLQDEMKEKEVPRRADILVRPKKKSPSPEPEPEPVVVEPPKSRFGAKRFGPSIANVAVTFGPGAAKGGAKGQPKEKTPPPSAPAAGVGKLKLGARGGKQPAQPEAPPEAKEPAKQTVKPAQKVVPRKNY
jgi:hypothetical protein